MDEQRTAAPAVVVGVDGSGIALQAVRWATEEAHRRGAPLRIVYVAPSAERGAAALRRVGSIVDLARTTAEQTSHDVKVSSACVSGHAAPALADAAADAQLLVVAMGGGERYEDVHLHSTALSVCTAARCPVAVVRGVAVVPADGPVVLGVEHVNDDAVAVSVAFADAHRHGTGVIVVHAVQGTGRLRDHLIGHEAHSRRGAAALTAVTDEITPWRPDTRRSRSRSGSSTYPLRAICCRPPWPPACSRCPPDGQVRRPGSRPGVPGAPRGELLR